MNDPIKILKSIYLLPVRPLIIIFSFYFLYLIYKNTNYVDFDMFISSVHANKNEENYNIEQDLPTELIKHMKSVTDITKPFLYTISFGLWYWFITGFIL